LDFKVYYRILRFNFVKQRGKFSSICKKSVQVFALKIASLLILSAYCHNRLKKQALKAVNIESRFSHPVA